MSANVSFVSPLTDAKFVQAVGSSQVNEILATISHLSGWTIAFTIVLGLVAYDQCKASMCLFLADTACHCNGQRLMLPPS